MEKDGDIKIYNSPQEDLPEEKKEAPKKAKFSFKIKPQFLVIGVVILIVLTITIIANLSIKDSSQTACTAEEKLCPDGSTVGRTGPDCHFAPCSSNTSVKTESAIESKEYVNYNLGYTFEYPETWELTEEPISTESSMLVKATLKCNDCSDSENVNEVTINPVEYTSSGEYLNSFLISRNGSSVITDYESTLIGGDIDAVKALMPGQCTESVCAPSTLNYFFVIKNQGFVVTYFYKDIIRSTKLSEAPQPNPDILTVFRLTD